MEMLDTNMATAKINEATISDIRRILEEYKQAKATLTARLKEDEKWWQLRHWEVVRNRIDPKSPKPTSAWLFNMIINRQADAMDNMPEPIILPREQSDEETAKMLQDVVPVILERSDYEKVYNHAMLAKQKHGCPVYGVFWDKTVDNGLGDIVVRDVDLLRIFWEPGIEDIQDSKNVFVSNLVDTKTLTETYPQYEGRFEAGENAASYTYDNSLDMSDKSVVWDWYYKVRREDGRTLLHYVKFSGDCVLYASENDPEKADEGWYWHGEYPFHFDPLYPIKGTPVGFGMIAICKDPQLYIDSLDAAFMDNALSNSLIRYFKQADTNISEEDMLDVHKPFVPVEGDMSDIGLKQIIAQPLPPIYYQIQQGKINEMKETSSNNDVTSGSAPAGVTAAASIAALQEAGNKVSRYGIKTSYIAQKGVYRHVVELMRQFYDAPRSFRITGKMPGEYTYRDDVSNAGLVDQPNGALGDGSVAYRRPIFDFKVKAQRKNPFSRMEQNERAMTMYQAGFFSPEQAQPALIALDMMDFEGKEKIVKAVSEGQTLLNMCQQLAGQVDQLMQLVGMGAMQQQQAQQPEPQEAPSGGKTIDEKAADSQTPMTPYGQALAKRSTPKVGGM